jgi:hypothetical protein
MMRREKFTIANIYVPVKVDNKWVDSYVWRLAAAFHAMRVQQTVAHCWSRAQALPRTARAAGNEHSAFAGGFAAWPDGAQTRPAFARLEYWVRASRRLVVRHI